MTSLRWIQFLGGVALLVAMLTPRIAVLRPHARRIGVGVFVLYLAAAAAFAIWRAAVGPAAPME